MNYFMSFVSVLIAVKMIGVISAQDEVWLFVEQPRCCSDCTFVSGRFKCKLKSCLSKCPFPKRNPSPFPEPRPEEDDEEEERRQREQEEERKQQTDAPVNNEE